MTKVKCEYCQSPNDEQTNHCTQCGAPMPEPSALRGLLLLRGITVDQWEGNPDWDKYFPISRMEEV